MSHQNGTVHKPADYLNRPSYRYSLDLFLLQNNFIDFPRLNFFLQLTMGLFINYFL